MAAVPPQTELDVVIVNWNSGELLHACLASLADAAAAGPRMRVVVVDNASSDGSCEVAADRRLDVVVIRNAENRGFAAACNQGAAAGAARLVLFLNPDTRVTAVALSRAVEFMTRDAPADVGICSIALTDARGDIARSCSYHPTPGRTLATTFALDRLLPRWIRPHGMHDFDHRTSRYVEQVIGAFFLVRRSLFDELGGFDERFFVYYEEVDFAFRAAKRGASAYFLADASAFHLGGGTTDRARAFRQFLNARSRMLYVVKHFGGPVATVHAGATLVAEPVVRTVHRLARGDWSGAREELRAARLLWRAVLRGRRRADMDRRGARGGERSPC